MRRRTLVIAEIGENHLGDMAMARRMIAEAATAGADIVKFQSYRAADVAPDDSEKAWFGTVELSDEELISASYSGDEIVVDSEIAEQVMLEIPYKPLCSESCRGLCPQCGADLNAGECGCDRGGINLKMAALKKIKIEK